MARIDIGLASHELHALAVPQAGKRVVVIGGGDTGTDCIGTSVRHGATVRGWARWAAWGGQGRAQPQLQPYSLAFLGPDHNFAVRREPGAAGQAARHARPRQRVAAVAAHLQVRAGVRACGCVCLGPACCASN